MEKSKSVSHFFKGEQDFYHLTEEDGVPRLMSSMCFNTEEGAKLAQALYNCLVAEDKFDICEFPHIIKYLNRMAGINSEWQ